ncbi:MAG: peptidoglycan-binding protein [Spartobacteria bacterium]
MKITKTLTLIAMIGGLIALAAPAQAQNRGNRHGGGGNGNRGNFNHGQPRFHNGGRVNVFFGGFGYPSFYGYPYYASPYYGYPYGYGYGYPVGAYYSYDPRGVYEGRIANPAQTTNDGGGKDVSMTARVQRQLSAAGYYRGAIDGIMGDGTRRAIRNYERDNGLAVDGRIDSRLLSTMGLG